MALPGRVLRAAGGSERSSGRDGRRGRRGVPLEQPACQERLGKGRAACRSGENRGQEVDVRVGGWIARGEERRAGEGAGPGAGDGADVIAVVPAKQENVSSCF